jgi:hypothetical protein
MPSIDDTASPKLKQDHTDKDLLTLYTPTTEELDLARMVLSISIDWDDTSLVWNGSHLNCSLI